MLLGQGLAHLGQDAATGHHRLAAASCLRSGHAREANSSFCNVLQSVNTFMSGRIL